MVIFLERCPLCAETAFREFIRFESLCFVRCAACDLIYKREMNAEVERHYDAAYFADGRARYERRWDHRVRKCVRQLRLMLHFSPAAAALLDVGCSAGYVLEAGQQLKLKASGIDPSKYAVSLCAERGLDAKVGSLAALPAGDESFDLVTLKHTLEHVKDPLQALRELHRVLVPGGLLLIVVPNARYWKRYLMPRRGGYFRPERAGPEHHVYYNERQLEDAARRAGFAVVFRGKAFWHAHARGLSSLLEPLRFSLHLIWRTGLRALFLRRELQLLVKKPGLGADTGPRVKFFSATEAAPSPRA